MAFSPRTLIQRYRHHETHFQFLYSTFTRSRRDKHKSSSSSSSFGCQSRGDDLKKLYRNDWLSPKELLQIFESIDSSSVLSALSHVSKRKDYKPNEAFYSLIITKLGHAGNFDAIVALLAEIKAQKSCRLSDEFFYNVIKVYGNVGGRINRAIETLFEMKDFNCWPSVKTFNFVLNLLVSSKQFDIIPRVYLGAIELGIEIDACCLNILIKGLCECGRLDDAYNVLDEFPKQGCRPNLRSYSTIMHSLCEHGRVYDAFELLTRLENEGISPDTITFNILISGLRKQGKLEEAIELLDRMMLKGCKPNLGSHQQVLYGLLEAKQFVRAKCFMNQMISRRFRPSFESYKLMILGLCTENLMEEVDLVLQHMVRHGFTPRMGMWRKTLETMFTTVDCGLSSSSSSKLIDEILLDSR
ncbi:hypothetical protein Dimus_018730 [Dionaea muscipula]